MPLEFKLNFAQLYGRHLFIAFTADLCYVHLNTVSILQHAKLKDHQYTWDKNVLNSGFTVVHIYLQNIFQIVTIL